MPEIENAIILCGGAGVRLRAIIGGAPKSLANVSGRPFLELLLRQLERHEFQRVILATGYAAGAIQSCLGATFGRIELAYSNEPSPLGTGGALRYAASQVQSADCLVMNGDSYTDVDLAKFIASHRDANADVSIVLVPADERTDSGSVNIDNSGNVLQFMEKQGCSSGLLLNAGIYALSRRVLFGIQTGLQVSLERELFPMWIEQDLKVKAFLHAGKCVDIGTPDRYQGAQAVLADAELGSLQTMRTL
jgi:NDP-sugar pyrophosphorylase family protein